MPTVIFGLASDTNAFQVAHRTGLLLRKLLRVNTKGTEKPWQFIRSMGTFFDCKFQFLQAHANIASNTRHLFCSAHR